MCVYVYARVHVCDLIYIYIYIYIGGVELSGEGSNVCHLRKARLFKWIELPVAVKWIYVK